MPAVELRGVAKTYPGGAVGLRPTDLAVAAGDSLVLVGPSGSGKSTVLRLIAGLEAPDAGEVRIGGRDATRLPPHRRGVGLLPQRTALYPHLTVARNIAAGGADPDPEVISLLGLGGLLGRMPHQLSGGERQRVGLAKLVARQAGVWLLDEPFAGLDPMFRRDFRHDLHLLRARAGVTMVCVSHDPADAAALGRRVGVVGGGELRQVDALDRLDADPDSRFVAACLGRVGLADGRLAGDDLTGHFVSDDGAVAVPVPKDSGPSAAGGRPGRRLTLGMRPEDVLPAEPGGPPPATAGGWVPAPGWAVLAAEPVGGGRLLTAARRRTRLTAWWPAGSAPPVGAAVDLWLAADRGLWFDGDTGRRIWRYADR